MKLDQLHSIYFLGIGGIGMSALARYFHTMGKQVSGYDKTETPLTLELEQEGMSICYEEDITSISTNVDLFVYTPAIPDSMSLMKLARNSGKPMMKRAEILGLISKNKRGLAVAGTHGKTSTTALLTHILRESGIQCTSFMGGIANNYQSNYVYGDSDWVVMEADEFDRSFLHLNPENAVLTSIDADHLDIYHHATSLVDGFNQFLGKVSGALMISTDCSIEVLQVDGKDIYTYGVEDGDIQAKQLRIENEGFMFDYEGMGHQINNVFTSFPGQHNIKNACAAISIALKVGCNPLNIKKALTTFKGVHRRFEFVCRNKKSVFIDDYAHHPTEIEAALDATRQLFPERIVTGIFQPHLFSRTRDFMHGFARALEKLDRVVLLDIYPAREEPIDGITSKSIYDIIENENKSIIKKSEIPELLKSDSSELIVTMGAGDIGDEVELIKKTLAENL